MQIATRKVLVLVSLLMPAAVVADDETASATDEHQSDLQAASPQTYWRESGYASYWVLPSPVETPAYPGEAEQPMASLDFRDTGAFARVSKVRELSLLTLAEVGRTRLYFGVNDDGLFGLHFGARPRLGDERCVELARMPYLNNAVDDRYSD